MSLLIDIVLAGAVLGGMYALIAMGLTLQYGVARIMNLSHGESLIAAAFGLLFVVQGIMLVLFGGQFNTMNYLSIPVNVLGSNVALNRLIALAFALVIGGVLYLALMYTRYGTAIRAVSVDPVSAQLVAIDVRKTSALAFAL